MIVEAEMSHVKDEGEVMLGGGLQRSRAHQLLTDGGHEGPASRRVPVNTCKTLGLQRPRAHQLVTDGGQEGPASRRVPANTSKALKGQCHEICKL